MYVNFSKETPHSKYFSGEYNIGSKHLEEASVWFDNAPEKLDANSRILRATQNIDIGWIDKQGVGHTEHFLKGGKYVFPAEATSYTPKFEEVKGTQPNRGYERG